MASVCRRAGIIGTVFLTAYSFAFAEDGEDASDVIDVRTDEVVVTATRFPEQEDVKRPVNLTVITRQEIEASPARTVPEVLSGQVGIVPSDLFGNNGANTNIDLRGFGVTGGQNTLILVNGRRVSDIDLSGVKWSAIPLSSVERIEIVRGRGSVLYGDGAVAGGVLRAEVEDHLLLLEAGLEGDRALAEGVQADALAGQLVGNAHWTPSSSRRMTGKLSRSPRPRRG